jgi:DNA-binding NtrC family response regulator
MPSAPHKPILLIDDDAIQLRVRQTILQQARFPVETATTADEALRLLQPAQGRAFAAVITDHLLAEGSGAELVPQIRGLQPQLPIVVITGLPGAEDEYTGWNIHFRHKPVPPEELIALARSVTQLTDPVDRQVDN